MSEAIAVTNVNSPVAGSSAISEKKVAAKKAVKPKKPSVAPTHPPTQQMVDASIKNLKNVVAHHAVAKKEVKEKRVKNEKKVETKRKDTTGSKTETS
ncbi:histone H1-like [Bactrocera neohumeralis]|uniref:histone H1-like n=1 Tax=Bactrocera neohumeralis TaxID=98809 RepID=UPI002166B19B|nr:histone H1-like [Bactrocera neohumeralis]